METLSVDVAVIGAGTAGLSAYRAAKSHHEKRVVLIEGGPYGTTCARVGCMPSKLLIAAAEAAHMIELAPGFGVHAGALHIDGEAVMTRVRSERDRFVGFVLDGVDKIPQADRLRGYARFLDPQRLQIDQHTIVNATSIVIATGSSPQIPHGFDQLGDRLATNDNVFEWLDLPESVAVIGTGVIGLELGQALHRLGVRVALFARGDKVAQLSDPEVRATAMQCLGAELDLRLHTQVLGVTRDGDGVLLRSRDQKGVEHSEHYSYVLAAAGRVPNTARLGLEHAGVTLDRHGVPLFDPHTMQCRTADGASNIFIAGDVNAERPLLHEAADQGRIAGNNAGGFPQVQAGLRRTPLNIAFTDPQIAILGQDYRSLKDGSYATGEVSFADQGRSRVMLQNRGLLRVYGEYGSRRFLGAEMIAPRGEHLGHLLAWACQSRLTVAQMLDLPFYHPVIEEGVRTALRDLNEKLLHGAPEIDHCADCTPGM